MPVRFTSPSLGGQRESFLQKGQWEIGLAFRHLYADKWFIGSKVDEITVLGGHPLYLDINTLDLSASYGVSERLSLTLTLPFMHGSQSRFYADTARHEVSTFGLGDITLIGNRWMLDPLTHAAGNISLGLGIKAPTGNNRVQQDNSLANGVMARSTSDQGIQKGDGGWGILVQMQAFHRLASGLSGYLFGSYMLSPRERTDVPAPGNPKLVGLTLSVPDAYTARGGLAFALVPAAGLSSSLGLRIDGIPLRDVIGGGDDGFRRPGYTLFVDPGVSWRRGPNDFTFSVPLRLHQNFPQGLIDRERGFPGGGDLADYLIFAGYTHRF